MSEFDDLVRHFSSMRSAEPLSAKEVDAIRSRHPGVPEDYLHFLEAAGHGDLGNVQIYSGPVAATSIYPDADEHLLEILMIGDDFQGYCFGFGPTDGWSIVAVSPRGEIQRHFATDFLSLLDRFRS